MAILTNTLLEKYQEKVATLPPSGGGGCHGALLGAATLGVMAHVPTDDIFRDLRARVYGTRPVSDREIQDAIDKALQQPANGNGCKQVLTPLPTFDAPSAIRQLIAQGQGMSDADIQDRSVIRIDWPPEEDAAHVIEALYQPDDFLFIGERELSARIGNEVRRASEWLQVLREQGPQATAQHIIPNPLTGLPGPKSSGTGMTFRGDSCIAQFRYAVLEFDGLPHDEQLAFWWAVKLPVVLLVDSGGKSVHGWVRIHDVGCSADWTRVVERYLFDGLLQPIGVDPMCKNESRLSRLPGHQRKETGKWQRLLYLAPNGKAVAA